MERPNFSFNKLAGAATHYARRPVAPYGTRGEPRSFYTLDSFGEKLDACFADLWTVCPAKEAEVIASAGAWVRKPGRHGEGRAFWTRSNRHRYSSHEGRVSLRLRRFLELGSQEC